MVEYDLKDIVRQLECFKKCTYISHFIISSGKGLKRSDGTVNLNFYKYFPFELHFPLRFCEILLADIYS